MLNVRRWYKLLNKYHHIPKYIGPKISVLTWKGKAQAKQLVVLCSSICFRLYVHSCVLTRGVQTGERTDTSVLWETPTSVRSSPSFWESGVRWRVTRNSDNYSPSTGRNDCEKADVETDDIWEHVDAVVISFCL